MAIGLPTKQTTFKKNMAGKSKLPFHILLEWIVITYITVSSTQLILTQASVDDAQFGTSRPVVDTNCGHVRGVIENGVNVFKGIPYAEAPNGQKRWQPPVSLSKTTGTCWSGTRDASTFGSKCVQPLTPANYSSSVGSEDCLYLNVWAPKFVPGAASLPVMVWIHGGGLSFGSGNEPGYSPTSEMVAGMGAVVVSMNYRMGAFGFLALDLLDTQSVTVTSGNYGFMDQIWALKWVKRNIENFGGNRNSVTLLGHSAGGGSIIALLSSPLAKGLFHGAWVMSPAPLLNKTASEAKHDNRIFLAKSGCSTISCLKGMTADKVFSSTPWFVPPTWTLKDMFDLPQQGVFNGGMAIIDGYVLPESPLDAWSNDRANSVPVVFGTTSQELDLYNINANIANWTWSQYGEHVKQKLDTFGSNITQKALELYPQSSTMTPEKQYTSIGSDIHVTCPTDVVADVADSYFNAYVYRYVVTQGPSRPVQIPPLGTVRYAFHGWDAYALFGTLPGLMDKPERSDLDFVTNIRQEVKHFVESGKPRSAGWYPFKINTAIIGNVTTVINFYHKDECSFWMKNGFLQYAWVD